MPMSDGQSGGWWKRILWWEELLENVCLGRRVGVTDGKTGNKMVVCLINKVFFNNGPTIRPTLPTTATTRVKCMT